MNIGIDIEVVEVDRPPIPGKMPPMPTPAAPVKEPDLVPA